ncbi:hypothetical protein PDL71_08715 [Lacibacter sp. MH-610]|uniref:hypothetical protein n=1 Tax=Lacibacter sp. MH-610 TaxID=3020883 RepID=UPI003891D2E1
MFSVNDFIAKYETYSNSELLSVHHNLEGYSEEAKEALSIVIDRKGGLEKLLSQEQDQQKLAAEQARIKKEIRDLSAKGVHKEFIEKSTDSSILSKEKTQEIVAKAYSEIESEKDDQKIKAKTVYGSLIGGLISTLICGLTFGVIAVYSNRIYYIFVIILVLITYYIIKAFTKQTYRNIFVLLATTVSVFLSIILAQAIYENPILLGLEHH